MANVRLAGDVAGVRKRDIWQADGTNVGLIPCLCILSLAGGGSNTVAV